MLLYLLVTLVTLFISLGKLLLYQYGFKYYILRVNNSGLQRFFNSDILTWSCPLASSLQLPNVVCSYLHIQERAIDHCNFSLFIIGYQTLNTPQQQFQLSIFLGHIMLGTLWTQVLQRNCTLACMFFGKVLGLNIHIGIFSHTIIIYKCVYNRLDQYIDTTLVHTYLKNLEQRSKAQRSSYPSCNF